VEGPITSITKFGAFVQLAEGLEAMIHVGDISAEKRINHPQDVLKLGQVVKAQVLELDIEKRRLRLGMKQLVPTSLDEYIAEHQAGDMVTGRMTQVANGQARVELGEGIQATCRIPAEIASAPAAKTEQRADLSSLTSMLQAKWRGGAISGSAISASRREPPRAGQIRTFRISRLDAPTKSIEVELV
jgi:small subunit ribosomal protein S1